MLPKGINREPERPAAPESMGGSGDVNRYDRYQTAVGYDYIPKILDANFINQWVQNIPSNLEARSTVEKPVNSVDYARISSWNIVRARELESGGVKKTNLAPQGVERKDLGLAA